MFVFQTPSLPFFKPRSVQLLNVPATSTDDAPGALNLNVTEQRRLGDAFRAVGFGLALFVLVEAAFLAMTVSPMSVDILKPISSTPAQVFDHCMSIPTAQCKDETMNTIRLPNSWTCQAAVRVARFRS